MSKPEHGSSDAAGQRDLIAELMRSDASKLEGDAAKEITRLRRALDLACSSEWSGYIHDYQRGHLSYHGMLQEKPLIWERIERNLAERKTKPPTEITTVRFAELAGRIAQKAAAWSADSLILTEHLSRPMSPHDLERFRVDITHVLEAIR